VVTSRASDTSTATVTQQGTPVAATTAKVHTFFSPVFTHGDLVLAERFAIAAVIAFPADEAIRHVMASQSLQSNAAAKQVTNGLVTMAMPGSYVVAYTLYGVGFVIGRESFADAGLHTLASVIVASHLGDVIKAGVGRLRPSGSVDAEQFKWGSPLSGAAAYSFPSGHATVAFAAAAAMSDELTRTNPALAHYANPVMYTLATGVGLARVYGQAHWASDVVAGAALGTFTARTLVRSAHGHPDNLLDRVLIHAVMTVDERGRTLLGFDTKK
jgi:membrane-associated phospholipid phosphatase